MIVLGAARGAVAGNRDRVASLDVRELDPFFGDEMPSYLKTRKDFNVELEQLLGRPFFDTLPLLLGKDELGGNKKKKKKHKVCTFVGGSTRSVIMYAFYQTPVALAR